MSSIGLNENHQNEIVNYLRFARYNRGQTIKSVDSCFSDIKDSRLIEDTYTIDEVIEMLEGLCGVVKGDVELELTNAAHTNVLLLRQLFSQAEKWHLKLQADISELENRKLLEEIAQFEENEFSASKSKAVTASNLSQKSKLQPLNEGGNTALLQMEINRLQEDNVKLKERVQMLERQASNALDEKTKLSSDLSKARSDLNTKGSSSVKVDESAIQDLSDKVATLNQDLRNAEDLAKKKCKTTEEELANTKHYVLALQHEIELLNKEIDKKFSETSQYKNLKKMLETKNVQIKDLRARLRRHEPNAEI
ncbi:leucine zipper transcription factor-like protein 1 [Rhopilema esculentum]|uniref:leucine zipper transcription factor-like protein 1 n=1 Tax=Rhopilema esculentum TaxID=499914 RepID=UPI0031D6BB44